MSSTVPDRTTTPTPEDAPVINLGPSDPATVPWNHVYAGRSKEDLQRILQEIKSSLTQARKRFKQSSTMDHEYWTQYDIDEIINLQLNEVAARSQLALTEFAVTSPDKDWYQQESAQKLQQQYSGWRQLASIAQKQKQILFDLFATSKLGLDLPVGVGRRESWDQRSMAKAMERAYCPDHMEGMRWDPVLHMYEYAEIIHAAHLFPWRQMKATNLIFGDGSSDELFTPANGLFLHKVVERALDDGLIAIVPDVDMEPADPLHPLDDQAARADRMRKWEQQPTKDYKVVVLNKNNPEVKKKLFPVGRPIEKLADLEERKLVFLTDARPRPRYVWWTFLNAVLKTAWNQSSRDEVKKATRYWETRRAYVKRNLLLGFVEELGQDVKSIADVEVEDDESGSEPDYGVISVMADEAVAKAALGREEREYNSEGELVDEDEDADEGEGEGEDDMF